MLDRARPTSSWDDRVMAPVTFEVVRQFDVAPRILWDDMIDWPSHGRWIPATKVESGGGDPSEVGYTFTAWTGIRPVALEDRMRVTKCEWDEATRTGVCAVDKLGPILGGTAGFSIRPDGDGSVLEWREDVTVRYLPKFLSPIADRAGAAGFRFGLRSLARVLSTSST